MVLAEQWVLVTGGARGLGQHITRALAREGAGVVINYHHSKDSAEALVQELGPRSIALQADVTDAAAVQQQFDGAAKGALNTIQTALPGMRTQGFGRIVNIGTNLFQNPVVPYHDYTAAKAALLSLTRTAAHDLGPHGITVNMVSGGLLRTTDASSATPEAVFDLIASMTPLRRVTTPAEFADAVLFFLSPWARAVTGQNLVVDCGLVKD